MRYVLTGVGVFIVLLALGQERGAAVPASGPRIERLATLETPRAAHTATALPSEKLLVAGGMGPGGESLASAELVDLSSATVTSAGSMASARASHTATPLPDGRVLLMGGYHGAYLASVERFDPNAGAFESAGRLLEGRSGHTATLLSDGTILVAGGTGEGWTFLASAEVFDPATGTSQAVRPMSVARESHTATLLADGTVLVVGGHRGRRAEMEVYSSAELYDPASRTFRPAGRLATARHKHDAVRLADGRVLVLGGADRTDRRYYTTTEIYDPARAAFARGPEMRSSRYKFEKTSILLDGGDVLVSAGARAAELLDARSLTFRAVAGEFPEAYYFATATRLSSGSVAIVGGYKLGNEKTAGVWRFAERH